MAINAKEFQELKEKVDQLRETAAKAKGAFDERMKELKEKYNCTTMAETKAKLDALTAEAEEAEVAYEQGLEEFNSKWGEILNNTGASKTGR